VPALDSASSVGSQRAPRARLLLDCQWIEFTPNAAVALAGALVRRTTAARSLAVECR
jgi:hypothetical protein